MSCNTGKRVETEPKIKNDCGALIIIFFSADRHAILREFGYLISSILEQTQTIIKLVFITKLHFFYYYFGDNIDLYGQNCSRIQEYY